MRRVIASIFVTLDGVVEDPRGAEGFELGGVEPQVLRPLLRSGARGGGGSGKPSAGKIMMGLARDSSIPTLIDQWTLPLHTEHRNWSLEDK